MKTFSSAKKIFYEFKLHKQVRTITFRWSFKWKDLLLVGCKSFDKNHCEKHSAGLW